MAAIGSLIVDLGVNTARFASDLAKAQRKSKSFTSKIKKQFKSMRRSINKSSTAFTKMAAKVALVAGPAALGLLIKSSFDTIDALAKTGDKLGIMTDKLAGLQHAANITGVEQKTLEKAITKQQKAIFDASRGLLTYKQHFDALNLSTKDLMELKPDEQFKVIGDALNKVENQTLKTAIAYDIFGGRGTALINTLALGSEGLERMQKEAEALGLAVSRVDAAAVEETNDAFQRMKGVIKGAGNTIAVKLAPFLTDLADRFTNAAIESNGFRDQVTSGLNTVIKVIGFVADAMRYIEVGWKTINVVFQGFIAGAVTSLELLAKGVNSVANALGMESAINPAFLEFAEATRGVLAQTSAELVKLTSQPMPSENIEQWKNEVIEQAQIAGAAIAESLSGGAGTTNAAGITAARKQELEKQLETLRQSILTEEEILNEKHMLDMERLAAAEQAKLDTLIPFQEMRKKMEIRHQADLGKIRENQAKKDKKMAINSMTSTMQIVGQVLQAAAALSEARSKKEFERNKKLQMGAVIVNTASAIMRAYADNDFWTATGISLALGMLGAAQLNKISSSSYSGGGSAPSGAASAPASGGGGGGGGGQPATAPAAAPAAASAAAPAAQELHIKVMIGEKAIIDTVQQATQDGTIIIDANAVRAA